jgi:hypothetical protein
MGNEIAARTHRIIAVEEAFAMQIQRRIILLRGHQQRVESRSVKIFAISV